MRAHLPLILKAAGIIFLAGIIYARVDGMDTRLQRIERIMDGIVARGLDLSR